MEYETKNGRIIVPPKFKKKLITINKETAEIISETTPEDKPKRFDYLEGRFGLKVRKL